MKSYDLIKKGAQLSLIGFILSGPVAVEMMILIVVLIYCYRPVAATLRLKMKIRFCKIPAAVLLPFKCTGVLFSGWHLGTDPLYYKKNLYLIARLNFT